MNLFPSPTNSPMAGQEWTMEVSIHKVDTSSQCTAVVMKSGTTRCHISVTGEIVDPVTARRALAEKARAWIAEYQTRRGIVNG